jgi:hypothetical protein
LSFEFNPSFQHAITTSINIGLTAGGVALSTLKGASKLAQRISESAKGKYLNNLNFNLKNIGSTGNQSI